MSGVGDVEGAGDSVEGVMAEEALDGCSQTVAMVVD